MDHTEAIVEIKNVISSEFIERMIPLMDDRCNKPLRIGVNKISRDIRNVDGHELNMKTPTNLFYWNFVKTEIERLHIFYKGKFPKNQSKRLEQIDLLKYSVGGKYEVHTDHDVTVPRTVSVIMNLNDEYEGGDLVFTDQKENEIKRFKLEKRSIVFFPSNFLYPHKIEPITKGTRYSIVAWLQ